MEATIENQVGGILRRMERYQTSDPTESKFVHTDNFRSTVFCSMFTLNLCSGIIRAHFTSYRRIKYNNF